MRTTPSDTSHLSADEFWLKVESGELPVDSHERLLRIVFIHSDHHEWGSVSNGVFAAAEQLRRRGWSFGRGSLRFNRY
jgi:hypothetical protein